MNQSSERFTPLDERIAVWGMAFFFLLAPFFPQLVHHDFAFAFRSFIVLLFALGLMRLGASEWLGAIRSHPLGAPAAAWLAGLLAAVTYSPYLYGALGHLALMISLFLLFWVLHRGPIQPHQRQWLVIAFAAGALMAAVHALFIQWQGHGEIIQTIQESGYYAGEMKRELIRALEENRALGRFGNPNHLAAYLVMGLWAAWWLGYQRPTVRGKLLWGLVGLVCLAGVYQTFSRSGLLIALMSLALMLGFALYRRGVRLSWRMALALLLLPVLVVIGLIVFLPPELFGGRLLALSTVQARLHFYRGALLIIQEFPLWGAGVSGFEGYYAEVLRPGDIETRYVHNFLLEAAVEGGVILFALTVWLAAAGMKFLVHQLRADPITAFAALGAGLSLMMASMVDFHNRLFEMWLGPLLLLSAVGAGQAVKPLRVPKWVNAAVLILLLIAWTGLIGLRYANQYSRMAGHAYMLDQRNSQARQAYQQAVTFDPTDAESWRQLGLLWMQVPIQSAQQQGLSCLETAVEWAPLRASFHVDYADALLAMGYPQKALEEIEAALNLFPSRPQYYQRAARLYRALDLTQAAEQAEQTAEQLQQQIEENRP